jgi:hypothetical protein
MQAAAGMNATDPGLSAATAHLQSWESGRRLDQTSILAMRPIDQ